MLAKTGPLTKRKTALAGGLVFFEDVGAGDVGGHQVGRELDAVEIQLQHPGQRADHERLGQPGHADQQAMAAGEDGGQQQFDDLVLADDDLVEFVEELGFEGEEFLNEWASRSETAGGVVGVALGQGDLRNLKFRAMTPGRGAGLGINGPQTGRLNEFGETCPQS